MAVNATWEPPEMRKAAAAKAATTRRAHVKEHTS